MHRLLLLLHFLATTWAQFDCNPNIPTGSPPDGCLNSISGTFDLLANTGTSTWTYFSNATLTGGVMKVDSEYNACFSTSTSEIVGSSDTNGIDGWSICSNGSVTWGSQIAFWACVVPGVYIFDRSVNDTCTPAQILVDATGTLYSLGPAVTSSSAHISLAVSTPSPIPTSARTSALSSIPSSVQSSAQSSAQTSVTTSAQITTQTPVPTAAVTATATGSSTGSHGLSTAAEAGIGVGAGLGGALIASGLGFLLFRRQKSRKDQDEDRDRNNVIQDVGAGTDMYGNKAELSSSGVRQQMQYQNAWGQAQDYHQGRGFQELEAQQQLGGGGGAGAGGVQELKGSSRFGY